jgi:putative ATPase
LRHLTGNANRSSVFTLEKHSVPELEQILRNALSNLPAPVPRIPSTLIPFLADVSDGDARQALNSLELALSVCKKRETEEKQNVTVKDAGDETTAARSRVSDVQNSEETDEDRLLMTAIKKGLRKGYDRTGTERYDLISAMHKSIRGSDGSAALYWLAR